MRILLRNDITLQWRQGFWLVYFIFTAIYVTVLLSIPEKNRLLVSLILILTDTTMLGVIFIGALVLLEKQQAVIQSLFVTPLEPKSYIWSKTISLSLIAICMSILVYLPAWKFNTYTPFLLATIAITAGTFVMLGLGLAARVETINQYFGLQMGISMLLILPVIPYMLLEQHPVFLFLPYVASLDLMLGARIPLPAWRILLDFSLLLLWSYVAYRYALRRVSRHLVYK
jgi:fluoroquinolone transport system permease protein